MYNNIYHLLIHLLAITYINSVIKFNIEINNQIYTLDHDKINNSSEEENPNAALINQNIYLCEDKTDCITCSFSMYQYASCYWDCDHSQCKTEYFTSSFGFTNDLSSIYQICSTCDTTSNEKMFRNCNDSILFKEDFIKIKKIMIHILINLIIQKLILRDCYASTLYIINLKKGKVYFI